MFLGHYALALAAKDRAPRVSLGWLFAAAQLPDLIWPPLLLAGVEQVRIAPGDTAFTPLEFVSYPWSHSLLAVAVIGVAFAGLYLFVMRGRGATAGSDVAGAAVLALLVVSHWVLDAVTHRPDLPLTPMGDARIGLGLWHSVRATLAVELAMFVAGVWMYQRATVASGRRGRVALAVLIGVLGVVYAASVFGPPPPGAMPVAYAGLGLWLFVLMGAWVDRQRAPRP